jgi:hypothetical protein
MELRRSASVSAFKHKGNLLSVAIAMYFGIRVYTIDLDERQGEID